MEKTNNFDYLYLVTRVIHWISALLFFLLAFTTGYLFNQVVNAQERIDVYDQHVSIGLLFALLTVIRLFWLLFYRSKRAQFLGAWQRTAAHINFIILYSLMFLLVISGIFTVAAAGKDLQFFTLLDISSAGWFSDSEWLANFELEFYAKESHRYLVNTSYVFLFVHVCGAMTHYARPQVKRMLEMIK